MGFRSPKALINHMNTDKTVSNSFRHWCACANLLDYNTIT